MPRGSKTPVPARRVFCTADGIAIGISEVYVLLGRKPYCITHARALVRAEKAEVADFVLLLREKEQDEKMRDELLSAALRARVIREKSRTASP